MSVLLDPADAISFQLGGKEGSKSTLTLTNGGDFPIAFKLKTTQSRRYTARPYQGVVDAGESTVVTFIIHPKECDVVSRFA